jgi:hypothetical protein
MRLASIKGLTRIIANTFPWQETGLYFGAFFLEGSFWGQKESFKG